MKGIHARLRAHTSTDHQYIYGMTRRAADAGAAGTACCAAARAHIVGKLASREHPPCQETRFPLLSPVAMAAARAAALTVWGRTSSSNTQKVLWTLGELDLPHSFVLASARLGPSSELLGSGEVFGVVNTPECEPALQTLRPLCCLSSDGCCLLSCRPAVPPSPRPPCAATLSTGQPARAL